jgi:hypothetical protein
MCRSVYLTGHWQHRPTNGTKARFEGAGTSGHNLVDPQVFYSRAAQLGLMGLPRVRSVWGRGRIRPRWQPPARQSCQRKVVAGKIAVWLTVTTMGIFVRHC